MNFPKFWARGESGAFFAWRWSSNSLQEAQTLANQAAREMRERVRAGGDLDHHGAYYPNRPFREQVLREFQNPCGEIDAVITRNLYGCHVLNTVRAMFVDIDFDDPWMMNPATGSSGGGFFARLFGKKPAPQPSPPKPTPEEAALKKIENWTNAHPDWSWRVYRTRAGLRLLATQGPVEADSSIATEVFEAFDADPLYRQLCKTQKCFRARLTPKPWRCGIERAPARWPWTTPKREQNFLKWNEKYEATAVNFATCEFVCSVGREIIEPKLQSIVTLHDDATRAKSKLQLA